MAQSNQGVVQHKAEDQPRDKERAQTVHKAEDRGSPSKEATRDPRLNDSSKTPGSGMTPDDSGDAPTG